MTVQIDQIFTATAENIWTFLSTAGQGCYIPAYQRPYAWDSRNVDRLFEDAIGGINHVVTRPAAISFLGTLIAIHDITHATVQPIFKSEVAPRVMTIIDGQQRITTSVMINIALHSHLTSILGKLNKAAGDQFDWVREQTELALAELWTTFAIDRTTGTPPLYRWYPRVIRAIDDVWSKKKIQAKYESPIAALTWAYISHDLDSEPEKKEFSHKVSRDGEPDPRHIAISEVFNHIVVQIERITGRNADRYDFPDLQQVVSSSAFMSALWSFPAPDSVVRFVSEGSNSRVYTYYTSILRTLIFYKFFCTRMALTIVTTRTEDDAFDMFEALNTTGEPLTAFETFRPKVIENEGLGEWEGSPSQRSMERVAKYLDAFKKADERQRATAELLIPFALAETGFKLSKSLSDQRRYLRDTYQELPTLEGRRGLVLSMASLGAFMETGWQADLNRTPHLEGVAEFDEVTGFCFQALRNLKHNVAIASLSRFYDELRRASDEERGARAGDFIAAVRATTAFSMLWRGAKGGTENIDQKYRSFMRDGNALLQIPPLAKRSGQKHGLTSLINYQRLLRLEFSASYPTRNAWSAEASRTPIYDNSAVVTKFLLICAAHDTVPDGSEGLIKKGRTGVAPTIRSKIWRSDATFSVEHVAPQTRPSNGWEDDIYEPGTKHVARLGNLTLLPTIANGYVGNKSWKQKRLIYRFFSSETQDDADKVTSEFVGAGLVVSEHGQLLLKTSDYMPMLKAAAQYSMEWNADIIERRSIRLAELAYDSVIGWLGNDVPGSGT